MSSAMSAHKLFQLIQMVAWLGTAWLLSMAAGGLRVTACIAENVHREAPCAPTQAVLMCSHGNSQHWLCHKDLAAPSRAEATPAPRIVILTSN